MTDIVVGAVSKYPWFGYISQWANSLDACGFKGAKVLLYQDVPDRVIAPLRTRGYTLIEAKEPNTYSPNLERWHWVGNLLGEFSGCRYLIHTDVKDVIFQSDPSEWLSANLATTDRNIVIQSEGYPIKDEAWNRDNVIACHGQETYERMKDCLCLNCGTVAGDFRIMTNLARDIHELSSRKVPIPDQAAANVLVRLGPYVGRTLIAENAKGWTAIVGITLIESHAPFLIDEKPYISAEGTVYTQAGLKFCMVHMYDRCHGMPVKQLINAKYWESGDPV